jgi:hypothetical protein
MQKLSPYVSDRKKRRARRRKYFLVTIGILALYGVFFVAQWFVIHSPVFRVADVKVVGNSAVASSDVIALAEAAADPAHHLFAGSLGFGNMLLWPSRIPASDTAMVPQLSNIAVSKDYFSHTVTLTVTERTPDGIWCFTRQPGAVTAAGSAPADASSSSASATGSATSTALIIAPSSAQCYWFDNAGTIFQKAVGAQGELIYVVDDSAQRPTGLNEKILPQEFLLNFLSVVNVLRQAHLSVKAIDLTDLGLQQVNVLTANGPTIYFSLNFPADEYLPVIQKLMLQPNFGRLQYIDCTTQNRMYYK